MIFAIKNLMLKFGRIANSQYLNDKNSVKSHFAV